MRCWWRRPAPTSSPGWRRAAPTNCSSLLCLARPLATCPLLVAPAMNREMWAHPATQRNVAQIVADGATVLGPAAGDQACGEVGDGRMLEAAELCDELIAFFQPKRAGRPLGAGHGRAHLRGHRPGARHHQPFQRQDGLCDRARRRRGRGAGHAGGRPGAPAHAARRAPHRRASARCRCSTPCCPRRRGTTSSWPPPRWPTGAPPPAPSTRSRRTAAAARPRWTLPRTPTSWPPWPACLRTSGPGAWALPPRATTCVRHAREKLARKGVPLIVANLGPATFGRDDNTLLLVDAAGERELPRADKLTLARAARGRDRSAAAGAGRDIRRMTVIDVKVLDARMAERCRPTPRPAAPAWTCAPAWTHRWCWRRARPS